MSKYPTFDDNQPGVQPGFAVQHNNPFPQPVHGQAYHPPAQYGGPQPIAIVVPQQNQQDDLTSQIKIKEIDQLLSSGCYSFYYYLLYVMLIFSGYALINLFSKSESYPMALEGFITILYSFTMLEALKQKSLRKARVGVCLSFFSLILMLIALYAQFLNVDFFGSGNQARTILYLVGPSIAYGIFVVIMPALKIKGHLERRELLLQKDSEVGNV